MTSAMSIAVTPLIAKERVLYLSPTTSTSHLAGLDDFFLRTINTNRDAILTLANHVINVLKLTKTIVIYDDGNQAFSKQWADIFTEFTQKRNSISTELPFNSSATTNYTKLTETLLADDPDGVLIVAAALDTAMICQQIRKAGAEFPIFTTMWAMSKDFIEHGGTATEGVSLINWFDPDHQDPASIIFRNNYKKRFGHDPTFVSHFAYETANILFYGLETTTDPRKLKETILKKRVFNGTQGTIELDQYGDATRDLFLMQVINGKYIRMKKF